MAKMSIQKRLHHLRRAKRAAEAVKSEIEGRNEQDINPRRRMQRRPVLLRARGDIEDLEDMIEDLEAASVQVSVEIDEQRLQRLTTLAADLDRSIQKAAIATLVLNSLTAVLNKAAKVRDIVKPAAV